MSDLADALRNLDDMRKQKNDTARELKELRQALPVQLLFLKIIFLLFFNSYFYLNMDAIN